MTQSIAPSQNPHCADEFAAYIASRADQYYPSIDSPGWAVTLIREHKRSNSAIYEFQLDNGNFQRRLIVKIPFSQRSIKVHESGRPDRPRTHPRPDPHLKGLHEFIALTKIHDHFASSADDQFGVIRPLELLDDPYLLIMEKGPHLDLAHHLRRANRFQRRFSRYPLDLAFRNSGDWLRRFHEMDPPDHCIPGATPERFRETCSQFLDFLVQHACRPKFCNQLRRRFESVCEQVLPDEFPTGVSHADYAPRNILVERNGRVTGFDTQARWISPIYEDIAHFLVAVKASGAQIASQGWLFNHSVLHRLEREFLAGYFSVEPPVAIIRLFECQRVLEWWSSMIFVYQQEVGLRRIAKHSRCLLWRGHLMRYLDRALTDIENER